VIGINIAKGHRIGRDGERLKVSVRIAGMGGQGIIFAGIALARAAALYSLWEGKPLNAIQTQSYGPAARGESSKCDVVICDQGSFYPFLERPDFLVLMSKPAYEKYIGSTYPGTVVILDENAIADRPELTCYELPAMHLAEEMGKRSAANMIMLGALVAISSAVDKDGVSKAIADISPMGSEGLNEKAFREGLLRGHRLLYQD
jgi:2-oxoglutarate ferredoxin oxidoreductase subunit gamma